MKKQLANLINKYKTLGLMEGGDLLLPPTHAHRFTLNIEEMGLVILIADGWRFFNSNDKWKGVIQDIGVFYDIDNHLKSGDDRVHAGAKKAREFIHQLPPHIVYVSFLLDIPFEWFEEIFLGKNA